MVDLPPIDKRAGPRASFTAVVHGVTKDISSDQLKEELGGVDVFTSAGIDGTTVVLANVDQAVLDAVVASHVVKNPRKAAIAVLREKVKTDPAFAALVQVLGIDVVSTKT